MIEGQMTAAKIPAPAPAPDVESSVEISLIDLLLWVGRWWWLILIGTLVGFMAGFALYLTTEERFSISLEVAIADMPLGTSAFIQDLSVGVLRQEIGRPDAVGVNSRKGVLLLTEEGITTDALVGQEATMRDVVNVLSNHLQAMAAAEYANMQADFEQMPPSPEAYAALKPLRFYLEAVDEKILEPATVVTRTVRRQGIRPDLLLVIGMLGGAGLAVAWGLVVDLLRRHKAMVANS